MSHQAFITWNAPPDAIATSTYNIYKAVGVCPASGTGALAFVKLANTATLSYTDTVVTVGSAYCYYGTQLVGTLESTPSNTVGGTVKPNGLTIQLVMS